MKPAPGKSGASSAIAASRIHLKIYGRAAPSESGIGLAGDRGHVASMNSRRFIRAGRREFDSSLAPVLAWDSADRS